MKKTGKQARGSREASRGASGSVLPAGGAAVLALQTGATPADRYIEHMALSALVDRGARRNPKKHDLNEIRAAMVARGFITPPILDDRTGLLVEGHGRRDALVEMRAEKLAPPAGVSIDSDGEWMVPVYRGWASRNDAEAEAHIIAANQLPASGGWHAEALADMLESLRATDGLLGVGFRGGQIDALLQRMGKMAVREKANARPTVVKVKPGELWALGSHRVLCGDSTKAANVDRLLGDERPNLMVTDPPYGVEYDASWRASVLGSAGVSGGKVTNDSRDDWREVWALHRGAIAYVWHGSLSAPVVAASLEACGFELRCHIIWRKDQLVVGRGHYHWQHEPCWYAVRKGGNASWCGDRKQSSVWDASPDTPDDEAGGKDAGAHSTKKPVDLFRRAIVNHTARHEAVFEPFLGSGTCVIACETSQRRCFALELEPAFVQQAIDRWENLTGKEARLLT